MSRTPTHLRVSAGVRYWEDAVVNSEEDTDGSRIPFRDGDRWCPTIDLTTGTVVDWPAGFTADVHYKVCDEGDYWLLDRDGGIVWQRLDRYVPDAFLCHGDRGYGDYIIMTIDERGHIKDFKSPDIDPDQWERA